MLSSISAVSHQQTFKSSKMPIQKFMPEKNNSRKVAFENTMRVIGWGTLLTLAIAGLAKGIISGINEKQSAQQTVIEAPSNSGSKSASTVAFNEVV